MDTQTQTHVESFIKNYASQNNLPTKDAAWTLIKAAMNLGVFRIYLPDGFVPDEIEASPAVPAVTAAPVTQAAPVVKAPRAPKVNAAPATGDGTRAAAAMAPTAIEIDGVTTALKSWRATFILLVETAIAQGVQDKLTAAWFKPDASKLTTTLSNGTHLFTNNGSERTILLCGRAAKTLAVPVIVTLTDGSTTDLSV